MDRTELEILLKEKVKKEYQEYMDEIMDKDRKYIIASAKEILDKKNILYVMDNLNFLTYDQLEILFSKDNTLEEIYTDYYDYDFEYLDDYRESIINTAYLYMIFED